MLIWLLGALVLGHVGEVKAHSCSACINAVVEYDIIPTERRKCGYLEYILPPGYKRGHVARL